MKKLNCSNNNADEWNNSFKKKDNFLFYPHEEVIRFVNKYLSKRTSYNENVSLKQDLMMLDLGCGIGRHVVYGNENNIDTYGFDLSQEAINYAKKFARHRGVTGVDQRFFVSDARSLPWDNQTFDAVISHGTLDSMPYEIAKSSITELYRVTKNESLFYCDLITSEDGSEDKEIEIVSTHENGTIQSFFSESKITDLFNNIFDIVEMNLIHRVNRITEDCTSRWHLVLKRIG